MGMTLKKLASRLKKLRIEDIKDGHVLLNGVQQLVDYIDSPWMDLMNHIALPTQLISNLLHTIHLTSPVLDLDTCTALAIQQAYLELFHENLDEQRGNLEARFDIYTTETQEEWRKQLLSGLVEKLERYEIDTKMLSFPELHHEEFVKGYLEPVSAEWLRIRIFRQEEDECEAFNFARRISYQLYPQLIRIIAQYGELYAPLAEYLEKNYNCELRTLPDIEKYRAYLMKLPLKPVFHETFALRDLYVGLNATDITQKQRFPDIVRSQEFFEEIIEEQRDEYIKEGGTAQLMDIVQDQLLEDKEHVVFIQGGPGMGKTTFCQMLAAQIATDHPDWIPVFIRLGDERFIVDELIKESIKQYVKPHFILTDTLLQNHHFLFILDGFNELWLAPNSRHTLKHFFERLSAFQKKCAKEKSCHHKIIVTGRPMRVHDLESELPANFLCLKIESMENPQFMAWLSNWSKIFGEAMANEFKTFLEKRNVFEEPGKRETINNSKMKRLLGEPLLLYMLGTMYLDGVLTQEITDIPLKRIEIYNRLISWVCCDTSKYHLIYRKNRILEESGLQPYELRRLLQEIALCIWHEGREFSPIPHIKRCLNDSISQQTQKLMTSGFDGIHSLLISCSFREVSTNDRNDVEFSHKSFGEYLTAERIVGFLRQIGDSIPNHYSRQEEYSIIHMKKIAHRFYSVFGATLLTHEIRDFVMSILAEELTKEELEKITERLYRLYIDYTDGYWIDEGITRKLWTELKKYETHINLLRFEAQAGINVFVLLCHLYQQTGNVLEICGREYDDTFNPNRFRKLLGFGEIVGTFGLFRRVHHLLNKVNLRHANLLCTNLRRANLQNADLQGAILRDANLRGANLQEANLRGTDLRVTNLQDANLYGADLRDANMEDVDLRNANLRGANLQGVHLLCADLRDADLQGANLQNVVLYDTNLRGALLQRVELTGAIISEQLLKRCRHLFSQDQISQLTVVHD